MAGKREKVVLYGSSRKQRERDAYPKREMFDFDAEEARARGRSGGSAHTRKASYKPRASDYEPFSPPRRQTRPSGAASPYQRQRRDIPAQPYSSRARRGASNQRPASPYQRRRSVKKRRRRRRIRRFFTLLCVFAALYLVGVYSSIPFIKKWRTIYIETAMQTMNHKWLATAIIPKSVIDDVMKSRDAFLLTQSGLESDWSDDAFIMDFTPTSQSEFFKLYHEVDEESFKAFIKKNPLVEMAGYEGLLIDRSGLDEDGTSIKTIHGDTVLTIDTASRLMIVRVEGDGYVGRLAIVKDPSLVKVGTAATLGKAGQSVAQIAERSKAVLAVNASGFADYQGMGNGGVVVGLLISRGEMLSPRVGGDYKVIGFSEDNRLYIGKSLDEMTYRDAVEFFPALIVNGRNTVKDSDAPEGSVGFGIQPRTAIGQAEDGTVFLLAVDGRKPGYSLGCTMTDLAAVMERYGAVQAANLDGGSSTVMVYRGQEISRPAAGTHYGRIVPNAIVVTSPN
ncbi:MAG TPA: phosphodiester glycosidase family protein [Papillibacter sp.]|nr:phosphodiester glycosidase family protein [Papillibacter sp.]